MSPDPVSAELFTFEEMDTERSIADRMAPWVHAWLRGEPPTRIERMVVEGLLTEHRNARAGLHGRTDG